MATTAPVKKTSFSLAPAGTHIARIYRFMNLGTRIQEFKGVPKDYPDTLVSFTLELPNEMNEFEFEDKDTGEKTKVSKPFVISQEFTLSMHKKSRLRPFVEGIIGTALSDDEAGAFDIEQLVGMTCQATIVHEQSKTDPDRKFAKLSSVAPLMKGIEVPAQVNDSVIQDVNTMSREEIDALPDFLQNKIKVSDEWKARFDPEEIARKQNIQDEINKRTGGQAVDAAPEYDEAVINPEDIPF